MCRITQVLLYIHMQHNVLFSIITIVKYTYNQQILNL